MGEIFPLVAGALIGLLVSRIAAIRTRWIVSTILTLLAGAAATVLSGEAAESWAFVLVDIGLVAVTAAIVWGIATFVASRVGQAR
jgi:1,4-dihydroxy-2-naphthoate octaprenyltransferase